MTKFQILILTQDSSLLLAVVLNQVVLNNVDIHLKCLNFFLFFKLVVTLF